MDPKSYRAALWLGLWGAAAIAALALGLGGCAGRRPFYGCPAPTFLCDLRCED